MANLVYSIFYKPNIITTHLCYLPIPSGAFIGLALTEERNPLTIDIDTLPTLDMLALINTKNQKVALAVKNELPQQRCCPPT